MYNKDPIEKRDTIESFVTVHVQLVLQGQSNQSPWSTLVRWGNQTAPPRLSYEMSISPSRLVHGVHIDYSGPFAPQVEQLNTA